MASTTIATISRSSLADSSGEPPKIADFKHLASYTWRNKTAPTITVPGCAPRWSPPSPAPRLEPDSGTVFIDQNAAQCPSSPLEPLFRAVLAQDPDFSLRNVDLVTDRGNIRKLLRFVQGFTNDHFRILVEVVRDGDTSTALFTRVEPKTTYTIHGFRGYGMTFETAYTAQGVGMNGYHRTLGYIFAGVRCVVRYETDGYVPSDSEGVDTLVEGLGGMVICEGEKTSLGLTVVRLGGRVDVPVKSTLEIKTQAASKVLDIGDVLL